MSVVEKRRKKRTIQYAEEKRKVFIFHFLKKRVKRYGPDY